MNFALLPDGGYVTCEKGLTRVKVYDPEGNFVAVVAGPEQFVEAGHACDVSANCQTGGLDVAVDPQGRILVLDPLAGDIRVYVHQTQAGMDEDQP